MKGLDYMAPAVKAIHEIGAELPEECLALMGNDLCGGLFSLYWESPYEEWMMKRDMADVYQSHKRQLQLLQWKFETKTWLLKHPLHLYWLKNLLTVYPDARIVQTHRDPVKVMPSMSSLIITIRAIAYDKIDPGYIGARALEQFSSIVERGDQQRREEENRQGSAALFHDVYFTDIVKDPMATIEKLYNALEMELSDETRKEMVRYLDESPRRKHGIHAYTLDQFGLEEHVIHERFHGYYKRFGL